LRGIAGKTPGPESSSAASSKRGGAELDEGRDLAHVGVADDDVQSAEPLGVGVRFVAGVDDGSLQRGLEPTTSSKNSARC
jgi:hypothetical protein